MIKYECLSCNKDYLNKIDKELIIIKINNTLLLADIFETFHLKDKHGRAALKKNKVKLELLTDDMLLMVEKEIRIGICHSIHCYAKANDKYIKYYKRNMESSYLLGCK